MSPSGPKPKSLVTAIADANWVKADDADPPLSSQSRHALGVSAFGSKPSLDGAVDRRLVSNAVDQEATAVEGAFETAWGIADARLAV